MDHIIPRRLRLLSYKRQHYKLQSSHHIRLWFLAESISPISNAPGSYCHDRSSRVLSNHFLCTKSSMPILGSFGMLRYGRRHHGTRPRRRAIPKCQSSRRLSHGFLQSSLYSSREPTDFQHIRDNQEEFRVYFNSSLVWFVQIYSST